MNQRISIQVHSWFPHNTLNRINDLNPVIWSTILIFRNWDCCLEWWINDLTILINNDLDWLGQFLAIGCNLTTKIGHWSRIYVNQINGIIEQDFWKGLLIQSSTTSGCWSDLDWSGLDCQLILIGIPWPWPYYPHFNGDVSSGSLGWLRINQSHI